jgi:hypothetical protein
MFAPGTATYTFGDGPGSGTIIVYKYLVWSWTLETGTASIAETVAFLHHCCQIREVFNICWGDCFALRHRCYDFLLQSTEDYWVREKIICG